MSNFHVSLPPRIYRYSKRNHAEQSLRLGEFRLVPAHEYWLKDGNTVFNVKPPRDYLLVNFSDRLSDGLFDEFGHADACLVIKNVPAFTERLHAAVQEALPGWLGIEARVSYGRPSALGPVFSKPSQLAGQREFRFVWQSGKRVERLEAIVVRIGDISDIAEIADRASPAH